MEKFVVTITREFGSLGRPIARRLAELLDVEFYDRDIVEETAKKMDMPVSAISTQEEKSSSFFEMLFPLGTGSAERQQKLFDTQATIIRSLAYRESCIIVGRCADYVLEDADNALHVYIYASYEDRFNNCVTSLGMQADEAKKMISEVDKARKSYHKHFAKYEPADPRHKHLIINSGKFGVEGTAQILADIVRNCFREHR